MLQPLLLLFGFLFLLATLLPLLRSEAWWIRVFDFPRLQIISGTLLCFILYALFAYTHDLKNMVYMAVLGTSILYQFYRIYPYTAIAKCQVLSSTKATDQEVHLSILVTNVLMTNRQSDKCVALIKEIDPDVVLAVETDKWWQKEMDVLKSTYPHTMAAPLGNTYGMLLYSKLPLNNSEIRYLFQYDIPSFHTEINLKSGHVFRFFGVHPRPPAPGESSSSIKRDAELIMVGKEAKKITLPVIVAGDLNDVAWSHTTHLFQKISGLVDPRVGRGMFSTFNANQKLLRWPLDHIFFSPEFRVLEIKRLPHIGSDHFPMYLKLSFEPEKKNVTEVPKADAGAVEEAKEKLENGKKIAT